MTKLPLAFALAAALAACAAPPVLYTVPPAPPGPPIPIRFASVEVSEVSLPLYAEDEDIYVEGAGGAVVEAARARWADDPRRATTLELARALGTITRAEVAAEPWPFEDFPDARLTVRAERMVAGADGVYRIDGLYHVADRDAEADRSRRFAVEARFDPAGGAPAIAEARGRAVRDLARQIASEGM